MLSPWCRNSPEELGANMNDWKKPEFVEIRMDAEINCYSSALSSALKDDPRRILKQPLIRDDDPETNQKS